MSSVLREPLPAELPYTADSADRFEPLADRPWSMFLDSGFPATTQGRYDLLVSDPVATLVTCGAVTEVRSGDRVERHTDDPLRLLQHELARHAAATSIDPSLPFNGGAVGYFAYDLGRRFEQLPQHAADVMSLPQMAVGIYDGALVVDHLERRCTHVGRRGDFGRPVAAAARAAWRASALLQTNLDRAAYGTAFERVLDYVRAGDCYQVNLARRFSAPVEGDPWAGYRRLRALNPAPYGAYLHTPELRVLSASPERFLRVRDGRVETRPIKGTRPRHADAATDRRLAQELLRSRKDRAENIMIVDLLRNDLGRVCEIGSVEVEALCELESFASVHHLVSTVSGRLAPGVHALDALRACFPGGSITGAPKIRAMQIIEELEGERRDVYCGAIGYVGFDGTMDMNVAIRTLMHAHGQARFWAGGGIVIDSDVDAEYNETLDKAAPFLRLLESES